MTTPLTAIETQQVLNLIGQLDDAHSRFQTYQGQLTSAMGELSPNWTGSAATTFQNAIEQWDTDFNQAVVDLSNIRDAMHSTYSGLVSSNDDATNAATGATA